MKVSEMWSVKQCEVERKSRKLEFESSIWPNALEAKAAEQFPYAQENFKLDQLETEEKDREKEDRENSLLDDFFSCLSGRPSNFKSRGIHNSKHNPFSDSGASLKSLSSESDSIQSPKLAIREDLEPNLEPLIIWPPEALEQPSNPYLHDENCTENRGDVLDISLGESLHSNAGTVLCKEDIVTVPAEISGRLLAHQREGVRFLFQLYKEKRGGILGDDMWGPFLSFTHFPYGIVRIFNQSDFFSFFLFLGDLEKPSRRLHFWLQFWKRGLLKLGNWGKMRGKWARVWGLCQKIARKKGLGQF